jgi:nicotinamide-nucleotide amidase
MKIAIVSIGNELLSGDTTNTNATWIGKKLTDIGCTVIQQITIPDQAIPISNSLAQQCVLSPDFVIITGGLGPTDDDITRQTLFDFVGTESIFDEEYWAILSKRFKRFGMDIPDSNRNQALIPTNGDIVPNPVGSARGSKFDYNGTFLISLPGVPAEMEAMMKESIIPMILEMGVKPKSIKTIRTAGIPESALIEQIASATQKKHGCDMGYYPSLFGVDIRISNPKPNPVKNLFNEISDLLGVSVYGEGKKTFEEAVILLAMDKQKTISTAESCTGGLIGHRLTEISGSSNVFKGGLVVYSNEAKMELLDIPINLLETKGAVSEETAKMMAENVKEKFKSDYGISVTGIAGPTGGTEEKPVGLVYIGLAQKKGVKVKEFHFGNDRKRNKLRTSQVALNWLRLSLLND